MKAKIMQFLRGKIAKKAIAILVISLLSALGFSDTLSELLGGDIVELILLIIGI